jgi:2-dehydro-3-deoxyphosphogluconate aldolase / (4S)-4-hydroxy-2-oxoglutarate aldolase
MVTEAMKPIEKIMRSAKIIPVLVIDTVEEARPLAQALVDNGMNVLEVTLRTRAALEVLQEMRAVEGAVIGAGTVINPVQLEKALSAGAEFIVSPGLTENLGKAAIDSGVPFLPGVANAGDIMRGLDLGLSHFKFFPAAASGGIPALRALSGPFGECFFCPTGGITKKSAGDWLALENVLCVGGSWVIQDLKV